MPSSTIITSAQFEEAADAFASQCSIPILVQLADEYRATEDSPPFLAFRVPETSSVTALARTIVSTFSRYLLQPSNPPMVWLSKKDKGQGKIPWTTSAGLLAMELFYSKVAEAQEHQLQEGSSSSSSSSFSSATSAASSPAPALTSTAISSAAATVSSIFPLKLYANFRNFDVHKVPRDAKELFPFQAFWDASKFSEKNNNTYAERIVETLIRTSLQPLKRSVATMNPDSFGKWCGRLDTLDMKSLRDFLLMENMSLDARGEFQNLHKGILERIEDVKAWPVLVHSLETGRTLSLAIPASVKKSAAQLQDEEDRRESEAQHQQQLQQHRDPMPIGIQGGGGGGGNFYNSSQARFTAGSTTSLNSSVTNISSPTSPNSSSTPTGGGKNVVAEKNMRETTFGDFVALLLERMDPSKMVHAVSADGDREILRRRLRLSGLPEAPLPATPLKWMMEHLVQADLCLHVLLISEALAGIEKK